MDRGFRVKKMFSAKGETSRRAPTGSAAQRTNCEFLLFDFQLYCDPQDVYSHPNSACLRAYCSIDNVAAGSINGFWVDGGNAPIDKFTGNIVSVFLSCPP